MSEERIAGQILCLDLDRVMEISESHAKNRAMEQLASRVSKQFPDCAMCKNLELREEMDHMRYRRKYAVTCKSRPAYPGGTITCPDGLVGRIDEKEKKFMTVPKPTMIWPTTGLDGMFGIAAGKEAFMREYMTTPVIAEDKDVMKRVMDEKARLEAVKREEFLTRRITIRDEEFESGGISKISAGLSAFGPGSSTGLFKRDSIINPQIPTDRDSFVPKKPINRDVPQTADEGAWCWNFVTL